MHFNGKWVGGQKVGIVTKGETTCFYILECMGLLFQSVIQLVKYSLVYTNSVEVKP